MANSWVINVIQVTLVSLQVKLHQDTLDLGLGFDKYTVWDTNIKLINLIQRKPF